ncbi:MAG: indolepyruvate oxidoreductase subunit beta [Firmicutes bacterium]|jgi:indolepyruvate ferredoxin oxidoreductase beta subunit|nr:indolepyruvate oxidoreductase subunit beta [Bacillota bacterium]
MNKTVLLVGVGGQGTILAGKVLAQVALNLNLDVKMSEIHGMAQRGGSVVTQIKMGEKIHSPMIEVGEADDIISFEKLEAQRYLALLKPGGNIVYNDYEIAPMTVITGAAPYPDDIEENLNKAAGEVKKIPAYQMAEELGNIRTLNIILLGYVAQSWGEIDKEVWLDAIRVTVPSRFIDLNIEAFERGYNY